MHITNQKLNLYIYIYMYLFILIVEHLQNILMEHDLYLIS